MTEVLEEVNSLIDTEENKPKLPTNERWQESIEPQQQPSQSKRVIEAKRVCDLSEDDKSYLYELYKNGG